MLVYIADILGALPGPALVIDADDRIAGLNEAAEALFGERSAGRRFGIVLRQPELLRAVADAKRTGTLAQARIELAGPHGRDVVHDARVAPFPADGGPALILLFQDLTEREAGNRMREDFVANVSHELKTPLTAIRGFLDTLSGPARGDEAMRARFTELMQAEVRRMGRLVDDLLTLSRVEAESARRPDGQVALAPLLDDVIALHEPAAREAGIRLRHGDWPDLPTVAGDADQLRQVVSNLIGNAIAHSGGSEVAVTLERLERDPVLRRPALRIRVADDGRGIEAHHLPRLTERFYRADDHRARQGHGGTGLGLSIVKHVLSRHRGRLEISSSPGQGARFDVILPLGTADTNL